MVKRIVPYLTGVGVLAILVLAIASPAHAQADRSFAGPFAQCDGHYVLVAHESDECMPLPTGVRISTRG